MPTEPKVMISKTAIRPALLYENEALPITGFLADRMSSCQMSLLGYCLIISLENHKNNGDIAAEVKAMPSKDQMRRNRKQWYGELDREKVRTTFGECQR